MIMVAVPVFTGPAFALHVERVFLGGLDDASGDLDLPEQGRYPLVLARHHGKLGLARFLVQRPYVVADFDLPDGFRAVLRVDQSLFGKAQAPAARNPPHIAHRVVARVRQLPRGTPARVPGTSSHAFCTKDGTRHI